MGRRHGCSGDAGATGGAWLGSRTCRFGARVAICTKGEFLELRWRPLATEAV
jgi:hypothetical protein